MKGVALRLRRLCSTTDEFRHQANMFMASLAARGHDPHIIHREFQLVFNTSREETRIKRPKNNKKGTAMFITKFNPRGPKFGDIIRNNFELLQRDPIAKKIITTVPIVYRRSKNLSEHILRADPYNTPPKKDVANTGTKHCGKRCDLCDNLIHSNKFICSATNRPYFIRHKLSCTTLYIIYLITCKRCNRQGVGSAQDMKPRWRNYKSDAKDSTNSCSVSKHFNEVCRCPDDPSSLISVQIIDHLENTDGYSHDVKDDLLLSKEKFWIANLLCMHHGLNSTHDWHRKKRVGGEKFT